MRSLWRWCWRYREYVTFMVLVVGLFVLELVMPTALPFEPGPLFPRPAPLPTDVSPPVAWPPASTPSPTHPGPGGTTTTTLPGGTSQAPPPTSEPPPTTLLPPTTPTLPPITLPPTTTTVTLPLPTLPPTTLPPTSASPPCAWPGPVRTSLPDTHNYRGPPLVSRVKENGDVWCHPTRR